MPIPRKLAIRVKFEKNPRYRTSDGIHRISSSSTNSSVPLVRTRRVRLPRKPSKRPPSGSEPGRGPVVITRTVPVPPSAVRAGPRDTTATATPTTASTAKPAETPAAVTCAPRIAPATLAPTTPPRYRPV